MVKYYVYANLIELEANLMQNICSPQLKNILKRNV